MRHLPLIALLTGCPAGGTGFPTNDPGDPAAGCEVAGPEYVASEGTFTTSQFLFDGLGVLVDQNPTVCVRSDGGGAAWLFSVNGEPYGMLRIEASSPGTLTPNATNLIIDLYGAEPTAARFAGSDYAGVFTIASVDPFSVALNGTAGAGGRNLTIQLSATATVPDGEGTGSEEDQ